MSRSSKQTVHQPHRAACLVRAGGRRSCSYVGGACTSWGSVSGMMYPGRYAAQQLLEIRGAASFALHTTMSCCHRPMQPTHRNRVACIPPSKGLHRSRKRCGPSLKTEKNRAELQPREPCKSSPPGRSFLCRSCHVLSQNFQRFILCPPELQHPPLALASRPDWLFLIGVFPLPYLGIRILCTLMEES